MDLAFIYLKGQSVLAPLVTFQFPTTLPSPDVKEENECYLEIGFTSWLCSLLFQNHCHNRSCDYTYKWYKRKKTSNNAALFSNHNLLQSGLLEQGHWSAKSSCQNHWVHLGWRICSKEIHKSKLCQVIKWCDGDAWLEWRHCRVDS